MTSKLKEEVLLALNDFRRELEDVAKSADCLAQEIQEFCGAIEEGEFDQKKDEDGEDDE